MEKPKRTTINISCPNTPNLGVNYHYDFGKHVPE